MIIVFSSNRKSLFVLRLKTTDRRRLQQKTIFLSECGKRLSLCAQIVQHSDHRCPLCGPDMNDACLCVCVCVCVCVSGHDAVTPRHRQLGALFFLSASQSVVFFLPIQETLCCLLELCASDLEEDERQPPQRLLYSIFKYKNLTDSKLVPKRQGHEGREVTFYCIYLYIYMFLYFQPHYNCYHLWTASSNLYF